jgi:hypothetical protein
MLEEHEVLRAGLDPEIGARGAMVAGNRRYLRIARVGYHDTSPGPLGHQCGSGCRENLGVTIPPLEDYCAIRSPRKAQPTLGICGEGFVFAVHQANGVNLSGSGKQLIQLRGAVRRYSVSSASERLDERCSGAPKVSD